MDKFNLIYKPWIPCLMIETNKIEPLGLLDTLTRAREIKEIADNSPLIVVSLHKLLLAILHRKFRTESYEDWKNLWRKGFWDAEKLREYFDKDCKDRFNLFEDERPFYQYPQITKKGEIEPDPEPLETLMQEKSAGNNATLFDHSFEANSKEYEPAVAVRYLVARQSFSFKGGNNYPFRLANSTLVNGYSILAIGDNLFETLALNLVRYPHKNTFPYRTDDNGVILDKPFWERDELIQATEKDSKGTNLIGYLDYLTWQSRRIKLIRDDNSEKVKSCRLQQNFKLKESELFFDPFKVYGESKDRKSTKVYYALDLKEDKSLWRDSHTIFQQAKTDDKEWRNLFNHLAEIERFIADGEIEGKHKYSISIFGLINKDANVSQWSHERLPLPLAYLKDNELLNKLEKSISCAEKFGGILRGSMKILRRNLDEQAWESSTRKVKDKDKQESKLINLLPALPVYWSSLEVRFKRLLSDLPEDQDAAMQKWYRVVDKTAKKAFNQSVNSLGNSANELKAIAKADKEFDDRRKNLKQEYGL